MQRSMPFLCLLTSLFALSFLLGCGGSPKPQTITAEEVSSLPLDSTSLPQMPLPPESEEKEDQGYTEASDVPEYIIGPGDILEISIWVGLEEQKHTVPVQPDGTITFAYLDSVPISDLTISQIRKILSERLEEYIKRPRVTISIKEYRSKMVSVFGEVKSGHYPLKGKTTLLHLLITAGANFAKTDLRGVKLIRRGKSYQLNLYQALFKDDPTQDVALEAGDVVIAPGLSSLTDRIYVLGEVRKPGAYPFKYEIDLVSALSQAAGFTDVAVQDNVLIIRGGLENPKVITINMKKFIKEADLRQNIALRSGDVIFVPRTLIGDIKSFAEKLMPILNVGRMPADYWYYYRGEYIIRAE